MKRRAPALIFIDIDGTLLDHEQQVPTSAIEACQRVHEAGHTLILSTGRSHPEIYPRLWDLGFTGLIGAAGGYIEAPRGHILRDVTLTSEQIRGLADLYDALGARYLFQGVRAMHPSPGFVEFFLSALPPAVSSAWQEYADSIAPFIRNGLPDTISKSTAYFPASDEVLDEIYRLLPSGMRAIPGSVHAQGTLVVEFMPEGISKGDAMAEVARELGFSMEDTIAIGDSHNDIEALEAAGVGVAMGNAPMDVQAHADMVTTAVNEDGLARAFAGLHLFD